jgi:type I site-specific restriction-modification system R (restriction) subunit
VTRKVVGVFVRFSCAASAINQINGTEPMLQSRPQYVQLFVIINGVNTKYLWHNKLQSVKINLLEGRYYVKTPLSSTRFAAAFF